MRRTIEGISQLTKSLNLLNGQQFLPSLNLRLRIEGLLMKKQSPPAPSTPLPF